MGKSSKEIDWEIFKFVFTILTGGIFLFILLFDKHPNVAFFILLAGGVIAFSVFEGSTL